MSFFKPSDRFRQFLHTPGLLRRTVFLCLCACVLLPAALLLQRERGSHTALPQNGQFITDTGFFFDTVVTVKLYGTDDTQLLKDCFDRMAGYEALLSRTRKGSDVWNINHSGGEPVTVSEETAELLSLALRYADLTDGAFDVTVAPCTDLWDFHSDAPEVPSRESLKEACSHVGSASLMLKGRTVTLTDPKAAIDLGGIAKGYIADRICGLLAERGVKSAFLSLGGNVVTLGKKPDGTPWRIGIRDPFGAQNELIASVDAADRSVVTSGTYERFFEKDGVRYHHILDPSTGWPVENGLESVTILSGRSVDGDALSTACFVLGLERGMQLIEQLDDTEALFITSEGELHATSGFFPS